MQNILERTTTLALTGAAVVVAAVAVHREFSASRPTTSRPAASVEYLSDWQDILPAGRAVGNPGAPIKVIEFMDLECPFCRLSYASVRTVLEKQPDVAWVFVHMPLAMHRFARPAARAAECAARAGRFGEMVNAIYDRQDSLGLKPWRAYASDAGITDTAAFSRCVAETTGLQKVEDGVAVGRRIGITGTPTVLVNGWRFGQPPTDAELQRAIDDVRAGRKVISTDAVRAVR